MEKYLDFEINDKNSVHMKASQADWGSDLEASRNLTDQEKQHFGFLLGWFESWRLKAGLELGRQAAVGFWRSRVISKTTEGLAVGPLGGSDALAWPLAGTVRRKPQVMEVEPASRWLTVLVDQGKVFYATQEQALNAVVFFLQDVCGKKEVLLNVRLRKTEKRTPVVSSRREVVAVLEKLDGCHRLAAEIRGVILKFSPLEIGFDHGLGHFKICHDTAHLHGSASDASSIAVTGLVQPSVSFMRSSNRCLLARSASPPMPSTAYSIIRINSSSTSS